MKKIFVMISLAICVFVSGCEYIAPDVSKALSESAQVELNERQVNALERIAKTLESK